VQLQLRVTGQPFLESRERRLTTISSTSHWVSIQEYMYSHPAMTQGHFHAFPAAYRRDSAGHVPISAGTPEGTETVKLPTILKPWSGRLDWSAWLCCIEAGSKPRSSVRWTEPSFRDPGSGSRSSLFLELLRQAKGEGVSQKTRVTTRHSLARHVFFSSCLKRAWGRMQTTWNMVLCEAVVWTLRNRD
jgi:hypothetical protein